MTAALEEHDRRGRLISLADGARRRRHRRAVDGGAGPEGGLRPGPPPSYPQAAGTTEIRLACSRVANDLIDEGSRRIGEVLTTALEGK